MLKIKNCNISHIKLLMGPLVVSPASYHVDGRCSLDVPVTKTKQLITTEPRSSYQQHIIEKTLKMEAGLEKMMRGLGWRRYGNSIDYSIWPMPSEEVCAGHRNWLLESELRQQNIYICLLSIQNRIFGWKIRLNLVTEDYGWQFVSIDLPFFVFDVSMLKMAWLSRFYPHKSFFGILTESMIVYEIVNFHKNWTWKFGVGSTLEVRAFSCITQCNGGDQRQLK